MNNKICAQMRSLFMSIEWVIWFEVFPWSMFYDASVLTEVHAMCSYRLTYII